MTGDVEVQLPDGSSRSLPEGSTALDLASAIGKRLAKDALAAAGSRTTDGPDDAVARRRGRGHRHAPERNPDARSSATPSAHVLAQAVTRLWPGAKYAIGPAIADGFYYDFELPGHAHFSDDDLGRIDAEMRAIIAEDQPFTRSEYSIEDGLALFADQPFKLEIINAVETAPTDEDLAEVGSTSFVSTYSNSAAFT